MKRSEGGKRYIVLAFVVLGATVPTAKAQSGELVLTKIDETTTLQLGEGEPFHSTTDTISDAHIVGVPDSCETAPLGACCGYYGNYCTARVTESDCYAHYGISWVQTSFANACSFIMCGSSSPQGAGGDP